MVLPRRGLTNICKDAHRDHAPRWQPRNTYRAASLPRLVNMSRFTAPRGLRRARAEKAPTCLATRHSRRSHLCLLHLCPSTFLRSLRSIPITGLRRYYGHSDSCQPGSSALARMNSGSCNWQVSLIHALDLLIPPSPPTPRPPVSLYHATPQLTGSPATRRSRLHHYPAGSPVLIGRIEFASLLRMDRSPPAAPHLVSRRRSCIRLQAGERMPGEGFHLSDQVRPQAH